MLFCGSPEAASRHQGPWEMRVHLHVSSGLGEAAAPLVHDRCPKSLQEDLHPKKACLHDVRAMIAHGMQVGRPPWP